MCRCNEHCNLDLTVAGAVPLLCLAAHAHYILIAWIADPLYAAGIGIYYAIFWIMNLIVLKQTFIGADKYFSKRKCCKYHMIFAVWAVLWAYEALIIYYILNIPINNSIEKAPDRLLTIIQSVGTLFLGLIAWKIIVDPRSTSENNVS